MRILAIETSCDETAAAVLEVGGSKARPRFRALSNIVSSQIAVHAPFGGVVPNLAKREHQKNLVPVLLQALRKAQLLQKLSVSIRRPIDTDKKLRTVRRLGEIFDHEPELLARFAKEIPKIKAPRIDAIAVTYGPGLAPALWTGVNFAKALSLVWKKPLIPVNHLTGHIYVNLLKGETIKFPALALIVSGGHTELVLMKGHNRYEIIGETRDDAAGEAFDKVAKLMGLGYPGGPAVSALADRIKNHESRIKVSLPRPMMDAPNFDFSFSGLKTAVLYFLREQKKITPQIKAAVAHEFQKAVVDVLTAKTLRAAEAHKIKTLILGGGVAANIALRAGLKAQFGNELPKVKLLFPDPRETTDNALMIAAAGFYIKEYPTPRRGSFSHENEIGPAGAMLLRADPGLRLTRS